VAACIRSFTATVLCEGIFQAEAHLWAWPQKGTICTTALDSAAQNLPGPHFLPL
jgi:hypothetical protein